MKKTFLALVLSIVAIAAQAALGLGDTFTVDSLSYYVSNASVTAPEAVVTGLSTKGKNVANLALAVHASVTYGGVTYAVKETNSDAFASQTNITSARLDYGITTVSSRMFKNCVNLRRVDLPSSLEYINNNAFQGCSKLADVTCAVADPSKLHIALSPFPSNSGMTLHVARTDANMQWRYKKISAFSNFTIVKDSEAYDHEGADGIRLCVISDFGDIWTNAARGAIVGIRYNGEARDFRPSPSYRTARGRIVPVEISDSACMNMTLHVSTWDLIEEYKIGVRAFANCKAPEYDDWIILNNVLTIGDYAFENFKNVTGIELGWDLKECNATCFDGMIHLEKFEIHQGCSYFSVEFGCLYNKSGTKLIKCPPAILKDDFSINTGLHTIGPYAFKDFRSTLITSIFIPYGVKEIGDYAFSDCPNLKYIKVPSSLKTWGKNVCYNTPKLATLYFNCQTPPQLSADEFYASPKTNLNVPHGCENAYKNADVWKTWKNIGRGAYDYQYFYYNNEEGKVWEYYSFYTIKSKRGEKINGEFLDGRAELTSFWVSRPSIITIPDYFTVTMGGYKYAVTSVGPGALNMASDQFDNITINLGANIDTIQADAFKGKPGLKTLNLNPNLKVIGDNAFYDCRIANDIHLPYGLQKIGKGAFYNNSFKVFHIPSSVRTFGTDMISKCNYLTDLIVNSNWMYNGNWDLTNISTSCRLYVPTGYVYQYKGNSALGKLQISAGAYDFTYNNADMNNSLYHITITDANPVTIDGVTYDGKAKYVCHPAHKTLSNTSFTASLYETNATHGGSKKYLMTEMADSVLDGCKQITRVSISSMAHLQRIGAWAFCLTGITGFTVPATCTYIGKGAFAYADKLSSLTLMAPTSGTRTWGGQFFYNNASNFKCYVKWNEYTQYKDAISTWTRYSSESNAPIDRLNSYFQMNNDKGATTFSVAHPVDWNSAGGLNAYVVKSYDATKKQVTTQKVTATPAGTGLLVTDYTNGSLYRLNRPSTTPSAPINLLVANTTNKVDIRPNPAAYAFNHTDKNFFRPSSNYVIEIGEAFLKLPSAQTGTTEIAIDLWNKAIKGDVNGDGVVNVSDVTALINKILGTATYADAVCDINADGQVNVSDVTALINMILG